MRDDLPPHLQRILDLRQHAEAAEREAAERDAVEQDAEAETSDEAPSLIVLVPKGAVQPVSHYLHAEPGDRSQRQESQRRESRKHASDQRGPRRNRVNGRPSAPSATSVCMTVADLADQLARTHPASEDSTRISASTTAGIVRDALHAMDPTTRDAFAGPKDIEAWVEPLCDHVWSLREHDVSPATLYALSPGSGMTAELQALAIAYEAYDRYLLESPQHDLADLCGWATTQLRTGRAGWPEAATVAVYDHIQLSGAAASFLRALRDYAGRFEQIGAGAANPPSAAGPPASVSARVAAPDRLPDLDAMLGAPSEPSPDSAPDMRAFFHQTLSDHRANGSSLSWIVASDGLPHALGDLRQMGWQDSDMDIAVPTPFRNEKANGQADSFHAVSFEAAGFSARDLLVVDASRLGHLASGNPPSDHLPSDHLTSDRPTPGRAPTSGATLLDAEMRQKIESLTGTVLPARGGDVDADLWQIAHMLWRHGGETVIVTAASSGPLPALLGKHLKPHVLEGGERTESPTR